MKESDKNGLLTFKGWVHWSIMNCTFINMQLWLKSMFTVSTVNSSHFSWVNVKKKLPSWAHENSMKYISLGNKAVLTKSPVGLAVGMVNWPFNWMKGRKFTFTAIPHVWVKCCQGDLCHLLCLIHTICPSFTSVFTCIYIMLK